MGFVWMQSGECRGGAVVQGEHEGVCETGQGESGVSRGSVGKVQADGKNTLFRLFWDYLFDPVDLSR